MYAKYSGFYVNYARVRLSPGLWFLLKLQNILKLQKSQLYHVQHFDENEMVKKHKVTLILYLLVMIQFARIWSVRIAMLFFSFQNCSCLVNVLDFSSWVSSFYGAMKDIFSFLTWYQQCADGDDQQSSNSSLSSSTESSSSPPPLSVEHQMSAPFSSGEEEIGSSFSSSSSAEDDQFSDSEHSSELVYMLP